jgi:hypothetical protein
MKKYVLKTKLGETINHTFTNSIEEAQTYFSKIKYLDVNQLLKIFIVEEVVLN